MEKTILVFGASVEWGAWDAKGGWVQRLKAYTDSLSRQRGKHYIPLYNLGISGDSTRELLRRMESEARARIKKGESRGVAIIIAIGGNDSMRFNEEKRFNVPLEEFRENLASILCIARKLTNEVAFVGIHMIDQDRVDPVPWLPEASYRLEDIRRFNSAMQGFCKKEGIPFIDIMGAFQEGDYREILEDGIHPNERGHDIIFRAVLDRLEQERILPKE